MHKKKDKAKTIKALTIAIILALISFTAHSQDARLLPFVSVSDKEKRELYLDEMYFNDARWPGTISYHGLSTKDMAKNYFSRQISAITTTTVSGCPTDSSIGCTPPSAYLLDDNFVVYGLENSNSIYIGNRKLIDAESSFVLKISGSSSLQSILGPEAISIYRLSHFFGLARLAEISREASAPPLTTCYTLLDKPYTCDNVSQGAMTLTGNIMSNYTKLCSSCTDADIATLNMISTHYLLRSKSTKDIRRGIQNFSRHDDIFKSVGINYEELKEIYLKSITN